ncbi:MAG TPA: AMP-binding protein [Acidimicrobiales bacterium]|nr:AMP-binding protein [Acidimicrobiales bacterium]
MSDPAQPRFTQPGVSVAADKTALVMGEKSLSFGELEERVERLARALVARGLEPGSAVAVMLPNGFEFMEVGLATARAGCMLLPVNWHLKTEEVAWILDDSGASLLIADKERLPVASESVGLASADSASHPCEILVVGSTSSDGYEAAIATAPEEPVDVTARRGRATPRYLFYTSGTTGRPRGVEREDESPDYESAMSTAVARMWGLTESDTFIESSPLYHAAGAYAFISLFVGGTIVILPRFEGRAWLEAVDEHRVTTSLLVPAHFIRILEVPDDERKSLDTSSLRLVMHSAAPCPIPVKRKIMDALATAQIWEFYGASEGGATKISPEEWIERPGSVGRAWPGVSVTIRDEKGRELPQGDTGLIYLSSRGRFRYHNDPDKTEQAWLDDAYTLGDVGHIDPDGFLYITDRSADMVIRGGVNIYPVEIEQVLHSHPAVVDCAVFGVPDDRMGEVVLAMVEVREPVDAQELQAWCRERLADFKCPETVRFVDELPRDPSGKVRKRYLREAVLEAM